MNSVGNTVNQIVSQTSASDQIVIRQKRISLSATRSYLEQTGVVCLYASASGPDEVLAALKTLRKMPRLLRRIEARL